MTFGWMETKWWKKSWMREERKVQSSVYVISPLHHRSFIFQTQTMSTNDVSEWQRAGWVGVKGWTLGVHKKRVSDRCSQLPWQISSVHQALLHNRLYKSNVPSAWHPQLEISTSTCNLELRRALWPDEHPAGTCARASTASLPNWAIRPVSLQAAQLRKPQFDEITLVFHFWNNDMVARVGVHSD